MMFLLVLFFLIVCGIAACLVLVQQGAKKIWPQQAPFTSHSPVPVSEQHTADGVYDCAQIDSSLQGRIKHLNALFALYQSGGLKLEEYERLKRDLIYYDRPINHR